MNITRSFITGRGTTGILYSLPALADEGYPGLKRMPVSLRIILESLLRTCDGLKVTERDVANLAAWNAQCPGDYEIPFTVGRIILQDLTGVPLLVDLAAMRSALADLGRSPEKLEPLVPVDLVVDHSVQVDWAGFPGAMKKNLAREFERNAERYEFLKWGQQAFKTFSVVPPSVGIVHQVNLEYLAQGVLERDGVYFPDTLVGTDSHTTMINGLGVVAWGVGGIEAEAGMLGQPVTFLVPEVVGVNLRGRLKEGVTATDLALYVTQMLRRYGVVGKFVEFFGDGAASLSLPDRATVANMAPEYGATMGFFPIDEKCSAYLRATGRPEEDAVTYENYYKAQGLWGMPRPGDIVYTDVLELDLAVVGPSVAGPRRPQDRIPLKELGERFRRLVKTPAAEGGFGKAAPAPPAQVRMRGAAGRPDAPEIHDVALGDGSILIAAITSCTNTSNDSLMLAAGLLARNACRRGLAVPPYVKTSIAPGSHAAEVYFRESGLMEPLERLGFSIVGYGCTTCIGNSGPLNAQIEEAVKERDLVSCAVLSGNRNFEARVHALVRANFLMSPPLVVAFALAGRVDIDLETEPLGRDPGGREVYLRDIWPSDEDVASVRGRGLRPGSYRALYDLRPGRNPLWDAVKAPQGAVFAWDDASTYIHRPPFFEGYTGERRESGDILDARPLGIFGDSVTTDHISPAGAIRKTGPAGRFLKSRGVAGGDFNSFGSRRGNDLVMSRGTFANVRLKNLLVEGTEGGYTLYFGGGELPEPDIPIAAEVGRPAFIFDAAMAYRREGVNLIILAGDDYGMGSSRDWAAKGTSLLGVKAVIAKSFERIHRSNLIGMGVLPLNFADPSDYEKVRSLKDAVYSVTGLAGGLTPRGRASLVVSPAAREPFELPLVVRIDTPIEKEYFQAGGILPYVLGKYCQ